MRCKVNQGGRSGAPGMRPQCRILYEPGDVGEPRLDRMTQDPRILGEVEE